MKLSDLKLTPAGEAATKKLGKQVHKSTVAAALEPKLRLGVIGIEIGQTQSTGDTSRTNESTTMKINDLLSEARLDEGYAIKLKNGSWYSEERPTLGPVKGGNSQVRVFKSMDAADDFLIKQQSSKYGGKKFEDAEIIRRTMQLRPKKVKEERTDEGVWVLKNQDGKEKRFTNKDSAAAKEWQASKSPVKKQIQNYSQEYWEKKEDEGKATVLPWSRITDDDILRATQEGVMNYAGFTNIDHWNTGRRGEEVVDGVRRATINLMVSYSFGKEDDMGLDVEADERISDSQGIVLGRDVKQPTRITFVRYS